MTTDRQWEAAMTEAGYMPVKDYVASYSLTENLVRDLKQEIAALKFVISLKNAYIDQLEKTLDFTGPKIYYI